MSPCKTVIFCCLVVCWNIAVLADKEEASEEVVDDRDLKRDNETSSAEVGPPDSHEAMNNREIGPRVREKRSYEFLMGLINNNSRYEVTRVDPSPVTEKPKTSAISNESKLPPTELLLELMVRIASHPQQWEKVHQLLQKLDRDLTTSRSIVNKLALQNSNESKEDIHVNKKKILHSEKETDPASTAEEEARSVFQRRKNDTKDIHPVYEGVLKWPTFDSGDEGRGVKFVNISKETGETAVDGQNRRQNKTNKVTYLKNFSYHRVTGKPIYLNKNPKAYIAVSAIVPKQSNEETKEDVTLENQLHQLKPWTRSGSPNVLSPLRTNWVIRNEEDRGKSVVPTL